MEVWQEAGKINQTICRLTRKFPREELFALTSQIRRASISVSSNIAEGSCRNSDKDFAHFPEQSYGSLMETAAVFFLALDESFVTESGLDPLFDELERLAKRIAALNHSLAVETTKTPFTRRPRSQALDPRPSTLD